MKYKILVGLLVASLVITSTTTVRAQALSVPSWVPAKIEGWTMVYNGSVVGALDLGGTDIVKSNWTTVYIKNSSTDLQGIVGVVTIEYTEDFFSKELPSGTKLLLSATSFSGSTVWDLFTWLIGTLIAFNETAAADAKASVPNAQDAFAVNMTGCGGWDFYLLYAYKGTFAMMVFAMNFQWSLSDLWGYYQAGGTQIKTWFEGYVGFLVSAFTTIMNSFASYASGLGMASIPETADIIPTLTQDVQTSPSDVNTVGNAYAGALPGGIPGYPVFLVGIASLFAVLVIVQKKRKAIVA